MYGIYEIDGTLIAKTEHPCFELYDDAVKSFYVATEETGRAILIDINDYSKEILPGEYIDPYHANIEGREQFSWLEKTVRVIDEKIGR